MVHMFTYYALTSYIIKKDKQKANKQWKAGKCWEPAVSMFILFRFIMLKCVTSFLYRAIKVDRLKHKHSRNKWNQIKRWPSIIATAFLLQTKRQTTNVCRLRIFFIYVSIESFRPDFNSQHCFALRCQSKLLFSRSFFVSHWNCRSTI